METLKSTDQQKIAEFVRGLHSLNSVEAISERVVGTLDTLIGGNSMVVVLNERKAAAAHVLAENVGPEYQKLMPVIWALRHEHPGGRSTMPYARCHFTRVVSYYIGFLARTDTLKLCDQSLGNWFQGRQERSVTRNEGPGREPTK
jgi:hypothetical protein